MAFSLTVTSLIESQRSLEALLSFKSDDYGRMKDKLDEIDSSRHYDSIDTINLRVKFRELLPELEGLRKALEVIEKAIEDRGYSNV